MKKLLATLGVFIVVVGGWSSQGPTSNCVVKPPTVDKMVPDPVLMPPQLGYGGKRALPNYGQPSIPVNKMQLDC